MIETIEGNALMPWWAWILVTLYIVGFWLTFYFQTVMAPNATLPLMALRCAFWPIYWATGWPHGVPPSRIG